MDEQSQGQQQEGQQSSGSSEWIGTPPAEGAVAPSEEPTAPAESEEEPLPGDEPIDEDDFAAAEDAAEHPEMDDAERDGADLDESQQAQLAEPVQPVDPAAGAELQQDRVEEAAQAHEERHSGEQQSNDAA